MDAEAPEALDAEVDERLEVAGCGDIDAGGGRGATGGLDLGDERLEPVGAAGAEDDGCAERGEVPGRRLPDAAVGAGDGDDLAVDRRDRSRLGWTPVRLMSPTISDRCPVQAQRSGQPRRRCANAVSKAAVGSGVVPARSGISST